MKMKRIKIIINTSRSQDISRRSWRARLKTVFLSGGVGAIGTNRKCSIKSIT